MCDQEKILLQQIIDDLEDKVVTLECEHQTQSDLIITLRKQIKDLNRPWYKKLQHKLFGGKQ